MYNIFKNGLIGNNALLRWKAYKNSNVGAYADGCVDNTTGDTTETNLANKYAKALVNDLHRHWHFLVLTFWYKEVNIKL